MPSPDLSQQIREALARHVKRASERLEKLKAKQERLPWDSTQCVRATLNTEIKWAMSDGVSYRAVALKCGIAPSQLYRFRDRARALRQDRLDWLGRYLGLRIRKT